jgi:TolB protein
MNRDGSEVRQVVFVEAFPRLSAPRWSHDGKRLVFAAHGDGQTRTLIVDVTGRNLIDLGAGSLPDWSPDDKQIVYEVPNVGRASVWVQNADGQGNTWLTPGSAPRFSPDGSRIATCAPLRIFDVLSGAQHPVFAEGEKVKWTWGCDWSPDGKQLAACITRDDHYELVLAELLEAPLRVRLKAPVEGAPAFSPDGKQLAVTLRDAEAKARRIVLLDVAGDDPPHAVPMQIGDNCDPAWSPDGKRVAFVSTRPAP